MAVRLSDQIIRRLTVGVDTQQINGVRLTNQPHPTYDLYVKGNSLYNGIIYVANGTTYYINNNADSRLRDVNVRTLGITQTDGDVGYGISLYGGPVTNTIPTYGIAFAHTSKFGKIENNNSIGINSDWATYFTMSDTINRGWLFRRGSTIVAGIDGRGAFTTAVTTSTHINGLKGEYVAINMTAAAGYNMLARIKSSNGRFNIGVYNRCLDAIYGADTVTSNSYTHGIVLLAENGVTSLKYLRVDGANHIEEAFDMAGYIARFHGKTWVYGPLHIGRDDAAASTGYASANVGANNYIAFYGVYGDNPGGFNHTYIGERIWGAKNAANEQSELLLFHGNDAAASSGPDRIRAFAGAFKVDVFTTATSGTWMDVGNSANAIQALYIHGTDGIILGNTTARSNGVNQITINGHLVINGSYNTNNSYSEGIRINKSSNNWSVIHLGGAAGSTTGTGDGQYLFGVNPSGNAYWSHSGSDSSGSRIQGHKGTGWSIRPRLYVNADAGTGYNFYVNGTSYFTGNVIMAAATESISATTGTLRVDGGVGIAKDMNARSLARNGDSMILAPGGGYFKDGTASKTGALKITLPQSWTATMLSFFVDIYDYSDNSLTTYHIGGYNYTGSGGTWVNCSATCTGTGNKTNLTVRFCHDGTKCCITIGEINTVWNYPKISIRDVNIGHAEDTIEKWRTGWAVSWVTTLPTVKVTKSNTATIADGTAGRMAWYKTYNSLAAANIKTDGSFLRNIGGYENNSYALSAASAIINSWIRTTGSTGWYSESYGGGWYMSDATWIRSYGSKSIYQNAGTLRTDGDFWADYVHIDDNWLGVYNDKGSTSKRYGYMQIDRSDNNAWRFVKENGGYFIFNSKTYFGGTSQPTTKYGTWIEVRAGDLNNDTDWQIAIKNQHNANATGWGTGIKFANGSEAETGKWAGIRGSTWSNYSNQTSLDLYASAARRLRLVDNELLPNTANGQSLGNKDYYYHHVHCRWLRANVPGAGDDGGITLYAESSEYSIMFRTTSNQGKHGNVSGDWATYFMMNNQNNRGWIFKRWGSYCVASISTQGQFWIGRTEADGVERQIGINNSGHNLYMYITNAGARGLYSGQGGRIVEVDTNGNSNRVYFADSYNHNRTALAYSQSAIKMHRANIQTGTNTNITYFTAWNNYELRAISQDYVFQRYDWWTSGNGLKVDDLRGGVTFAYTNHGSAPTTGTIAAFDCASNANYTLQIMGSYGAGRLYFRNRNGDNGSWGAWRQTATIAANTAAGDANNPIYINSSGEAVITNRKLGAQNANGYWGMGSPDNAFNVWIRTTTQGILPYQSGGVGSGHQSLGTSSWFFSSAYVDNIHGHCLYLEGATNATMTSGTTNPRIIFQEGTGTQPVVLAYTDHDSYRGPAGLKVVGGASATPAWFEIEGNIYVSTSNTTGNGIYLADDGSIVDNNDGYCAMRFSNGILITNGKNANTTRMTLRSDGWIYFYNSGNGLYWPNCNGAHLYANSGQSTYGALVTQGARNGYNGLHLGNNTNYMTLMDNSNDKGLFQEGKRWILWYNRGSDVCCIMGSQNSGWRINLNENTYCYGAFYSGDIRGNKVRLVDDWVGYYQNANAGGKRYGYIQCNVNRMYFRKENGTQNNISFDFAGHAVNTGEWMSTANNGLRCRRIILRDDGSNFYFLVGTNGTPGDNWNGLRPFYFNTSNGYSYHTRAYQAVWNDYAEFRQGATTEPGRVVIEHKSGTMQLCQERLAAGGRIISDTYGNAIGETKQAKTPIAVSGRVLVYPYKDRSEYPLGAAVCTAPNGTVDIMTREEIMMYPDRIIGTVSEIPDYEIWHCGGSVELGPNEEVKVNGRIWVYVR